MLELNKEMILIVTLIQNLISFWSEEILDMELLCNCILSSQINACNHRPVTRLTDNW